MENIISIPTAALIALIIGLIEVIKYLVVGYIKKSEKNNIFDMLEAQGKMINKLHEMHNHYDVDGIPIWYFPRSWIETQKEMLKAMSIIVKDQEKIAYTLERIDARLEK